jgi:tRNA (guanine37-N1)-methyltransferase
VVFDVLTIFPGFFTSPLEETILKRAREKGLLEVRTTDMRTFATDKHAKTDDIPFGGGPGMVMKPEPVVAAIEASRAAGASKVYLLDPIGRRFDQSLARELASDARATISLVCGRYEGFDERIREFADGEISVGDVVLSGGEPAALLVIDAVARLLEGVLGNEQSTGVESFAGDLPLLEAPSFTRPRSFRGKDVPDVLTSGDHEAIRRWRRRESLRRTLARRPDLVRIARENGRFSPEDQKLLDEIEKSK